MKKNRVEELRKEKGLTQKELGDIVNVSGNTIYNIERGQNIASETLLKLSDFFEKSTDYILGKDEKESLNEIEKEVIKLLREDKNLSLMIQETINAKKKVIEYLTPKVNNYHAHI